MSRLVALLALAFTLTACVNTVDGRAAAPPNLAWQRPITDAIANMGSAMGPVGDAMVARDFPAMRTGCTKLESAIDRIGDRLPTPDPAVNEALQDGVDNYRSFAKLCATMTPVTAELQLDRLDAYLDGGTAGVRKALHLMGIDLPTR